MIFRLHSILILSIFLSFLGTSASGQDLYINEFKASNGSGISDEDGDREDWIELYNGEDTAINLKGYFISDDEDWIGRWEIPDTTIAPGGFLLLFASGKDRSTVGGSELHTNFRISSAGEPLILSSPQLEVIDSVPEIPLRTDISYGRQEDGGSVWVYYDLPTPGVSNSIRTGFSEKVSRPEFSQAGGFYRNQLYLSVTHPDPSVTIRYTIDGSEPNVGSPVFPDSLLVENRSHEPNGITAIPTTPGHVPAWFRWESPSDTVFKGTAVRIKAFKDDALPSESFAQTYWVDEQMPERYDLPVVSITMQENHLFGPAGIYTNFNSRGIGWERPAHIEFYEPDGRLGFMTNAGIRIHGGNSRRYALKSFRLYFRNRYGESRIDYPIFRDKSVTVHERLLLRNSGSDWARAYFRDAALQYLVKDYTNLDLQHYRPSVVFLNGEYWGLLNFRDRYDNQYIENHYGYKTGTFDMLGRVNTVEYGNANAYDELLSFLQTEDLNEPENEEHLKNTVDLANFRDYHILQIFIMNTDQPGKNVRFWKPRNEGKWKWLVYDLDDAFLYGDHNHYSRNGFQFCIGINDIEDPNPNRASNFPGWAPNGPTQTFPLRAMLQNDYFRNSFINRFADLMNTAFHKEHVIGMVDHMQDQIAPYIQEHINKWHRPIDWVDRVDLMREFANGRAPYIHQHLVEFFKLDRDLQLTVDVNNPQMGEIKVNSIVINADSIFTTHPTNIYPWEGTYYSNTTFPIIAQAKPGYQFLKWEGMEDDSMAHQDTLWVSLSKDTTFVAIFEPDPIIEKLQNSIVINEVMMEVDDELEVKGQIFEQPWLEVHNHGTDTLDLSNCYFTTEAGSRANFQLPFDSSLVIYPDSFMVFHFHDGGSAHNIDLTPNPSRGEIQLIAPDEMSVIDHFEYQASFLQRSFGRFPDAAPMKVQFNHPTPGASNVIIHDDEEDDPPYVSRTETEHYFEVYPNPTRSVLNINLKTEAEVRDIIVLDNVGKTIMQEKAGSNSIHLNVDHLAQGVYMLRLIGRNEVYHETFIKQ